MKPTIRFFWRSTVAVVAMLALGACAVGVPDDSDGTDTAEGEDGIVTPMEVLPINPSWVGTCSQGYATYILRRATAGCPSFSIDGGTWWGCRLQADEPNFCVYKWSKATAPTTNAYMALQGKAVFDRGHYSIAADCSENRATCGAALSPTAVTRACGSEEECCNMKPLCGWNPDQQLCQCYEELQPACDVCGFIRNGTLYAVIDPRWPNVSSYLVYNMTRSWVVAKPARSSQSFQVLRFAEPTYSSPVTVRPNL